MLQILLVLCAVGAVIGTPPPATTRIRGRRSTFLKIIGERPNKSGGNSPLLPVALPVQLGGRDGVNVTVLVVPVPVFTKASDTSDVDYERVSIENVELPHRAGRGPNYYRGAARHGTPGPQFNQIFNIIYPTEDNQPLSPTLYNTEPQYTPQNLQYNTKPIQYNFDPEEIHYASKTATPQPNRKDLTPTRSNFNSGTRNNKVNYEVPQVLASKEPWNNIPSEEQPRRNNDLEYQSSEPEEEYIPFSEGRDEIFATSEELIRSYLRQRPNAPQLPAVVPSKRRLPERIPVDMDPPLQSSIPGETPPVPDFNRSLHLRIDLTVPRSDYTEAYDIVWHKESNSARTVVEDGTTTIYRVPLFDGRVQYLKVLVDRLNGTAVRRCTTSPLLPPSAEERAFPGLPDMSLFYFTNYTTTEGGLRVERWQHVVLGEPGELGAAQGESLNFTHEMLVIREGRDAVPLRYSVTTDSSVLGAASDTYTHRYQLLPAPTGPILPDTTKECDTMEELKVRRRRDNDGKLLNAFNPLRLFTGRGRDPEYDDAFSEYSVTTDSSVLGAASDTYTHRYQLLPAPTGPILPDTTMEELKVRRRRGNVGKLLNAFNPLRLFTGRGRDPEYDAAFSEYRNEFKRKYRDPKEEAVRKSQFITSRRYVDATNRVASSFLTGINYMADRVAEELEGLSGVLPKPEGFALPGAVAPEFNDAQARKIAEAENIPKEFDWRTKGAVTTVRNQDNCRSCWAFAVAGAVEGALFNKTGKLVSLSPQSLIDCAGKKYHTMGCKGGWPASAFGYVQEVGLPSWESYIYKKKDEECKEDTPAVTRITDFADVQPNSEAALKVAIYRHGPVVVVGGLGKDNMAFKMLAGGVLDNKRCSLNQDHAVLAIGWGSRVDGDFFIIKNSWGKMWGSRGFAGVMPDSCSIMEEPSYPLLEEPLVNQDVLLNVPASEPALQESVELVIS